MLSVHFNFAANNITRNVSAAANSHAKAVARIASGDKINVAADAPADLIMSEKLRSQIDGLERAMQNATESSNILNIADGALGQVQGIITKMSGLAIEAANSGIVSPDRVAANQAAIDSGLQAIDRILETTRYGGRKLLGNMQERGVIDKNYVNMLEAGKFLQEQQKLTPGNVINLGGENGLTAPAVPGEAYARGGMRDSLFRLDRDQNHAPQISYDGKTLSGEKTFVLPPAEKGGEAVKMTFAPGASLDEIVSALRDRGAGTAPSVLPPEGEAAPGGEAPGAADQQNSVEGLENLFTRPDSPLGRRVGTNINTVELDASQLAMLAGMDDESAKAALGSYMNNFAKGIELDFEGWNKLSDADQQMLLTGDRLSNLEMGDLAGIGDGANRMTLDDLYSGGKASLTEDPALAIDLLNQARKSVTRERAQIAATQAMAQHSTNADGAALEALTRMDSYLRDTAFEEATVEMARTEVLQQTGMALLKKSMQQHQSNILNLFA